MIFAFMLWASAAMAESECGSDTVLAVLPAVGSTVSPDAKLIVIWDGTSCTSGTDVDVVLTHGQERVQEVRVSSQPGWSVIDPGGLTDGESYLLEWDAEEINLLGENAFTVEDSGNTDPVGPALLRNIQLSAWTTRDPDMQLGAAAVLQSIPVGMRWEVRPVGLDPISRGIMLNAGSTTLQGTPLPWSERSSEVCFEVVLIDQRDVRSDPSPEICFVPSRVSGCGCSTGAGPTGWGWLLGGLLLSLVRRRR